MGGVIKKVFVFGNPDVAMDALPVTLLPLLRAQFPEIEFLYLDPNEEWEIPDPLVIIDTVVGIPEVRLFEGLQDFRETERLSVHDFDAHMQLRLLAKLGKLGKVFIIGVPVGGDVEKVKQDIVAQIKNLEDAGSCH